VLDATFNQPEHPAELTPKNIGVQVGSTIRYLSRSNPRVPMRWDGQRSVTQEEFAQRVKSGELRPGPALMREAARLRVLREGAEKPFHDALVAHPSSQPVARSAPAFETEWERFTHEFIVRYELNADQTEKAWTICRECQARGSAYVRAKQHDFDSNAAEFERLRITTAGDAEALRAHAEARRVELLAPLQVMFDQQLRPRLDALPTRAQRKAAEVHSDPSPRKTP
jgi:hypothetical protein